MSSWSSVVALSGFHYEADRARVVARPQLSHDSFQCFWATGTGWGTYSLRRSAAGGVRFTIQVLAGTLPCGSCTLAASGSRTSAHSGKKTLNTRMEKSNGQTTVYFAEPVQLREADQLEIEVLA
jgi:hypothetical protein